MSDKKVQGEGDRASARHFNEQSEDFVNSAKGREAIKETDHSGKESDKAVKNAEREAAARAKEKDPEATRDFSKPAK